MDSPPPLSVLLPSIGIRVGPSEEAWSLGGRSIIMRNYKTEASIRVSHYAAKYAHKDKIDKGKEPVRWNKKQNVTKKSYYTHEDSDGLSNSD